MGIPQCVFQFHCGLTRSLESKGIEGRFDNFQFHCGLTRPEEVVAEYGRRPDFQFHCGLTSKITLDVAATVSVDLSIPLWINIKNGVSPMIVNILHFQFHCGLTTVNWGV